MQCVYVAPLCVLDVRFYWCYLVGMDDALRADIWPAFSKK